MTPSFKPVIELEPVEPLGVPAESELDLDIEHCRREIRNIERELLSGNPDVQGFAWQLSD